MIKDLNKLEQEITTFLKKQLVQSSTDGFVIHLDGTLMSVVSIILARKVTDNLTTVITTFGSNKSYLIHLLSLCSITNTQPKIFDLSKDLGNFESYKKTKDIDQEISLRKRLSDLTCQIEADQDNLTIIGNLAYSQWIVNFPHRSYKNKEHVYPLNRLFYSEVRQLAKHLQLPDQIIDREPSHYIYKNKSDQKLLEFNYHSLENYLREKSQQPTSLDDIKIRDKIVLDDREKYISLPIQRPSSILG